MQTRDGDANAGRRCKLKNEGGQGQREHNLIRECVCSVDFPTEKVSDLQESKFGLKDLRTSVQKSQIPAHVEAAPAVAAPAPAVVAPAVAASEESSIVADEETYAAMRWASKLQDDANVLSLIRSLPKEIIEEQLRLYRNLQVVPAVAEEPQDTIVISTKPGSRQRMSVAARFHKYCKHHGIDVDKKLPYGAITSFMTDHIVWTAIILQGLGPRRKGTTLTQAALLSILL